MVAAAGRKAVAADQAFADRNVVSNLEAEAIVPVFLLPDLAIVEQDHHLAVGSLHDVDDRRGNLLKAFVGHTEVVAGT